MSIIFTSDAGRLAGLDLGSRRFLHPGPLRWLRATGWAIALFFVFSLAYGLVQWLPTQFLPAGPGAQVAAVAILSTVSVALYALLVRLCEARWPSEFALAPALPELLVGLVVGAAMMSAVVGLLVGFGFYDITGPRAGSPLDMIKIAIMSGVMEELIMRAILMRLLMRAFGVWPALAIQAALFGVMHLGNPNASATAAAAIAVEAGLMLAAFYLLTGRIWVSIGVHAAWNFTQGWVWGARVSGIPVGESLFVGTPRAGVPELLSGGAFGPEASLPAMVVGTGVAVLVLYWAWKKGNFRARPDGPRESAARVAA